MKLTIAQALQQGVAAHKEGRTQDAERLYRAILQSQPAHPDANHNLGVLAVSVNKADAALPLFKTALEANPKIEQFWLSYIDALIKEKQFYNAKQVLEQAKTQGVDGDRLNSLEAQLSPKTQKPNTARVSPPQELLNSLLGHYQNGRFSDAEKLSVGITQDFPKHQFAWKVLGAVLGATGRKSEAADANQTAVTLSPQDAEAHNNLGITLQELGRIDEAEASFRQAIALNPNFTEAHSNLGNMLKKLGRLEDAEASYTQAIALKPDFTDAHYNLGITLQTLGRLEEAEASFTQAIALKPDYVLAHYNLGIALKELGRLDEAEASYTQAIAFKPDYAEAHYNLGITLQELGRLDEAEANYRQAIALKPSYAEAHNNLGVTLQELGRLEDALASYKQAIALKPDFAVAHYGLSKVLYSLAYKDSALESIKKANAIDPESKDISLLLSVLQARKSRENTEVGSKNIITSNCLIIPPSIILELNKSVEQELIAYLYNRESVDLSKEKDPSFGDTRGSKYDLFEDNHPTIQKLALDLNSILMKTFNSDVFIKDSFFSIFGASGGTAIHCHLNKDDKDSTFSLAKQKYSLVYYLSVGDQDCTEPGFLKFYEPSQEILPSKGLITIFSADRNHSSLYDGSKDRVIVGVNFYTL